MSFSITGVQTMRAGFIGGLLIIGACLLVVVTAAIAAAGGQVSVQGAGPGSFTLTTALALLAVGAFLLGLGGRRPLNGRFARFGLILSGIGLTATLSTANVSVSSMLVLVFLIGGLVAWIGVIVTAIAVLATPGRPRQAGLIFVAGLLIAAAAGGLNNVVGSAIAGPIALVGGGAVLLGIGAIGMLGVRGGQVPVSGPAPSIAGAD
jgi:hypothetical protein